MPADLPYNILGTADDGKAYFIGRDGRIMVTTLQSLSTNKLLTLASLNDWKIFCGTERGNMQQNDWQYCYDAIIQSAAESEFDPKSIRGRGAWREADNAICYHNGNPEEIEGDPGNNWLYIKKNKIDIGIKEKPADKKICHDIRDVFKELQFAGKIDRYRALGWALLAPFSGALPFRPACLITGPSESGKSSLSDFGIRRLALEYKQWPHRSFNGGSTTVPGIMQDVGNDSGPIIIEEAEGKGKKGRELREDQFSLMRQSTSDDAPKTAKGTADGSGVSYANKNMFLFISISPIVDETADANRITLINLKIPNKAKWRDLKGRILEALTLEKCRRIRALTWSKLKDIIEIAEIMAEHIQEHTKKNHRSALADALLISAYLQVIEFLPADYFIEDRIKQAVVEFYAEETEQEKRDDTEDVIRRILDEPLLIQDPREKLTIRQAVFRLHHGYNEEDPLKEPIPSEAIKAYKQELATYGLAVVKYKKQACDDENWKDWGLAISGDHHKIMEIINMGRGYAKILARYKNGVKVGHLASIGGSSIRCTLLFNIIDEDNRQMEIEG